MARYCEVATCAPTSAPAASFSWASGGIGVADFTDLSTNTPTSWSWDFGDGAGTSSLQNPSYTYTILDTTYNVCLIATNGIGSDTFCDSVYIDSTTGQLAPVAAFTSIYQGVGLFDFTDGSTNTPTSWAWDFGDGSGTSTSQNPSYTYSVLDSTYNVCLTATNGIGSDTFCDSVYADTATTPGMAELKSRTAFTIYPNPSTGEVNLKFTLNEPADVSIRVMDITARVLYTDAFETNAGDKLVSIRTDLNAGQYIMELTVNGVGSFLPLIIE